MAQAKVAANTITYNAVLDATFDKSLGFSLFQQSLALGQDLHELDLHGLSEGVAFLAVRWWLAEVRSKQLRSSISLPDRLTVITGWGESRREWQDSDVKSSVLQSLETDYVHCKVDKTNKGCIVMDVWQLGRLS